MKRMRLSLGSGCVWLCMLASVPSAPADADSSMAERVRACDACHGEAELTTGGEQYYPPIAGKPVEYLYQQLLNFRDSRRSNPTMKHMLAFLDDAYLHEIAQWYASLPSAYDESLQAESVAERPESEPEAAARARMLVLQGEGTVPACAACHGGDLRGDSEAIPGLRGLPEFYLSAQLGAWKAGTRRAREPDCMAEVARALSGADVEQLARWIASVPSSELSDLPVNPHDLPLDCGAVQ